MDAAEYKHVVLGLIFPKYISNAFDEQHAKLYAERAQGAAAVEDDDEPFGEKMTRLTAALRGQMEESAKLDKIIWANLEDISYGL